jgi:hypothetical protein
VARAIYLGAGRRMPRAFPVPGTLPPRRARSLPTLPGLFGNLMAVTLGNIADGTILVGAVYWLVYLREKG